MSSEKKESNILNDNDEKNKYSRNSSDYYKSLKISNINNNKKRNKNGLFPKNIKKKIISESSKFSSIKKDKTLLNSLSEFNLINNTPIQTRLSPKYHKYKTTTNYNRKENSNNNDYHKNKKSKNKNYNILSSNKEEEQTTSMQSSKITEKKRMINFRSKLIDKSKSQEKNVQIGLEPFFERLSQNKKDKDILLNNIRLKSVEKENLEIKRSPKILPYSLLIIKNKYDKSALYQPNQTKEKYIEKDAKYFYSKILKHSKSSCFLDKYNKYKTDYSREKFDKFYEDNIKWINNIESKNRDNKLKLMQEEENIFNKYPFKPKLNKNSLNIANKLILEKDKDNNDKINQKENLDRYKIKLKNIINDFYDDIHYNHIVNKKKSRLVKSKTKNYFLPKLNPTKKENKNKKIEENKKDIYDNFNSINKYTYIMNKKKKIRKKNKSKKKNENDIYNFYKINVNTGPAWMNQSFNQIKYDKKHKKIIKNSVL